MTTSKVNAGLVDRAPIGLSLTNLGGAVPFGISDLGGGSDPNALEWTVSILFAVAVVVILVALRWKRSWLAPAVLASGALWVVASIHMLINGDLDRVGRAGLALIFAGIAATCWFLAMRFRAHHREVEPGTQFANTESMAGPPVRPVPPPVEQLPTPDTEPTTGAPPPEPPPSL